MILGMAISPDENSVKTVKEIGYRYVEIGLRGVYGENEDKLEPFLKALDKYKIRCEAAHYPFPSEYNPSGTQSAEQLEKAYDVVRGVVKKTKSLNIERFIIGAGGARVLPSPDKYINAMEQMAEICKKVISPVLSEFGIIAAIEGLQKRESTILTTTGQSVELARMVDLPNIKVMADLFHVAVEGENFADFVHYKGFIQHSHIGHPTPRVMPAPDDGYDYKPFFEALHSANFNNRMTVEAAPRNDDRVQCMKDAYTALIDLC